MAVGRGKSGSPLEGQKSLLKQNGTSDDADDDGDEWHVAYNKPSVNGSAENSDRKRHSSNVSATQRSVQSRIEDLELDDAGFVDRAPRIGINQKAFFAIVVGVAIGVAAVVSVVVFYFRSSYIPNNYIIVVDAGSSHTKLNVFHYRGDKINGTGKIEQLQLTECNGTLRSFIKDPERLRSAWEPCLALAKEHVPEDRWEKTEVYVAATAGLRQLRKSNPAATELLLHDVRALLNESYNLSPEHTHVLILDGEEEGALAWATVNFVTKNLLPDNITMLDRRLATYGSLDLGGLSTQIAFTTTMDDDAANFKLTFFGVQYRLYSRSFMCRGKGEAHRILKAQLVVEYARSANSTIPHPCFPANSLTLVKYIDLFQSDCTSFLSKESFYRRDSYLMAGTGNITQCRAYVRNLFNESKCPITDLDCSFKSKLKGMNVSGPFMGFAGFFLVMEFFNLTHKEDDISSKLTIKASDFRDAYTLHCKRPWSDLSNSTNKFIKGYCFDGIFIETLLYDVYGFDDAQFERTEFRSSVNSVSTGWAVGLALNSTNAIPPENELEMMSKAFFLIFLVIFAVFLVLAISFLCRGVRRSCRDNSI